MAEEMVTIKLSRLDIGQIIDGLISRRDSWRETQKYLDGEEVESVIEDCSDPEEAGWVADNYDRIIKAIQKQIK